MSSEPSNRASAELFSDPLRLSSLQYVYISTQLELYRENLAAASNIYPMTFIAAHSEIHVYFDDPATGLPARRPAIVYRTKPLSTAWSHIRNAITPSDPHNVNRLKIAVDSNNRECLLAAFDDGRVQAFWTDAMADDAIYGAQPTPYETTKSVPPCFFSVQMDSSAWGMALSNGRSKLVVSDNSGRLSLLDFKYPSGVLDAISYYGPHKTPRSLQSENLEHNIPYVTVLPTSPQDKEIVAACVTIKGHVIFVSFGDDGVVESSVEEKLMQEGWTINCVEEWAFKEVESYYEATCNKWFDQSVQQKYYRQKNAKIFGGVHEYESLRDKHPKYASLLLPSGRFTTLDIPTVPVDPEYVSTPQRDSYFALAISRQALKESKVRNFCTTEDPESLFKPRFRNSFLIITTKKSIYLCRSEDMFCNAARANVFNLDDAFPGSENALDRLSIVNIIPELSAVVVATNKGAVAVFRMVRYKYVYTLRQEYVLPSAGPSYSFLNSYRYQDLVGIAVTPLDRERTTFKQQAATPGKWPYVTQSRKFRLSIVYASGIVMCYVLSRDTPLSLEDIIV